MVIIVLSFIVIFVILFILAFNVQDKRLKKEAQIIDNLNMINFGDGKSKVISLLGQGYNINTLKDGTEKYTWNIQKGYNTRYGYVRSKKIIIKFYNNKVIFKKSLNLN